MHHIRRWADYPALRTVMSNLITLCKVHHSMVWSREEQYEEMFMRIVQETPTWVKKAKKGKGDSLILKVLGKKYGK